MGSSKAKKREIVLYLCYITQRALDVKTIRTKQKMTRPIVTAEEKKYNATRFCTSPRPERKATDKVYVARVNAFLKEAKKNVVLKAAKKNAVVKAAAKKLEKFNQAEPSMEEEYVPVSPSYRPTTPCYCPSSPCYCP